MQNNKPWTYGPYELISHAEGHLKSKNDFDRRIALIGFDNAIEVCIDVFVNLNPKLRNNYQIRKDEKERILSNYHTKLDFLALYLEEKELALHVSIEEILWYHSLRNQLYHSGNGMTPEIYAVEGAKKGAINVYEFIFETEYGSVISEISCSSDDDVAVTIVAEKSENYYTLDPQMDFLVKYIKFEKQLRVFAEYFDPLFLGNDDVVVKPLINVWHFINENLKVPKEFNHRFEKIYRIRNNIVHFNDSNINNKEFSENIYLMENITNCINDRITSSNNALQHVAVDQTSKGNS